MTGFGRIIVSATSHGARAKRGARAPPVEPTCPHAPLRSTIRASEIMAPGARTSVKQQGYLCHMYVSPFGVTAVCFADDEYPSRVAFGYLSRLSA